MFRYNNRAKKDHVIGDGDRFQMAMRDEQKPFALIHIDAGDWSKPANTLIEKCAEGIAAIARPIQIVRSAKAEAQAEKIRAIAQIEVDEIQRRAVRRFIAEETKRQHNMEAILKRALPDISRTAKPEKHRGRLDRQLLRQVPTNLR